MNIRTIADRIGMDYEGALEYYGGDVSLLKSRLESFVKDVDFPSLKLAVENRNEEETKARAHRMRKLSEKVCLTELVKLSEILENARGLKEIHAFLTLEKEFCRIEKLLTKEDEIKESF